VTQSAAQADAFYREVLRDGSVWTIRDGGSFPAPVGDSGKRTVPFWSSRSRAQKITIDVDPYRDMEVVEIDIASWKERWLPGLERDGRLVGLNWSGERATGYDVEPADVLRSLATRSQD
jgi:uncharacterized protein DUF2750